MNFALAALRRLMIPQRRSLDGPAAAGIALNGPALSGIFVTPQTALSMTAVFAAINVIGTDVASLPFGVYRRVGKGGKRPAPNDPRHRLIHTAPNPEQNAFRFRQALMGHVLGWGNGYAEVVRDGSGMPTALYLLHPGQTKAKRTDGGRLFYQLDNGRKLLPENVIHVAGMGFDGLSGYSPVTLARQAIGLGIAAEEFGAALFGNGAVPKGMLKTPKKLSEPALANLRKSFNQVHQGTKNAHNVAILEEGLEWVNTQINPDDAQFLATRAFQVVEIARLYRLPPHKVGDYSQSHLANVEEANLDYLTTTLTGWLESIEAEFNAKLFFADEGPLFCEHNMAALMRGNSQARADFYGKLFGIGALTIDDILARENINPIGKKSGGSIRFIPVNLATLDSLLPKEGDPAREPAPDLVVEPDVPAEPDPEPDPADEGGGDDSAEAEAEKEA